MLKITRTGDSSKTLRLEGKLLAPWVDEVFRVLAEFNGHADSVRLDLAAVSFVDAAGAQLLRDLIRRGVVVAVSSPFVAELLHRERP